MTGNSSSLCRFSSQVLWLEAFSTKPSHQCTTGQELTPCGKHRSYETTKFGCRDFIFASDTPTSSQEL